MTKNDRLAIFAAALGLICLGLRAGIWTQVYDPTTQLTAQSPLLGLFAVGMAVCALILCLLYWRGRRASAEVRADAQTGGLGTRLLRCAAGVLSFAAGVLSMIQVSRAASLELISVLLSLVLVLQGGALCALAVVDWDRRAPVYTGLLLLPTFAGCYWLVAFYHTYGATPGTETYLWPMVAGLVTCAAWLHYAGYSFRAKTPRAPGLLYLLALLTIPPALAAPMSSELRLALAAQFCWFLAAAGQISFLPEQPAQRSIHVRDGRMPHAIGEEHHV